MKTRPMQSFKVGDPLPVEGEYGTKVPVLVVATEWFPRHGGLPVFNRWLCGWLQSKGKFWVICFIPSFDANDVEDAGSLGVELVKPCAGHSYVRYMCDDAQLMTKPELPRGFFPQIIIGHDRKTGLCARFQKEVNFPEAKLVQIIHMEPEDSQRFRPRRNESESKKEAQKLAIANAALVLGVGPKLTSYAKLRLQNGAKAIEIVPDRSILIGLPKMPATSSGVGLTSRTVNFSGRIEDIEQKGINLLADAWKRTCLRFRSERTPLDAPMLVIRGARDGIEAELAELDKLFGDDKPVLHRYDEYNSSRLADLQQATLAVMPSKGEGFGLAALEAVYHGTPVLVSEGSGIARLLQLVSGDCSSIVRSVHACDWSDAIHRIFEDPPRYFDEAQNLRTRVESHVQNIQAAALGELLRL
jgi:glycosyltransferase involved in cell wall biosynthesis